MSAEPYTEIVWSVFNPAQGVYYALGSNASGAWQNAYTLHTGRYAPSVRSEPFQRWRRARYKAGWRARRCLLTVGE